MRRAISLVALIVACYILSTTTAPTVVSAQKIWSFCSGDKQDPSWLINVNSVEFNPSPPKSGAPFKLHVTGDLKQDVGPDAVVSVDVAYSGISLFQGDLNVCESGFLPCPVAAGKFDETIEQDIPPFAPPGGPYTGSARLADGKNNTYTCIKFDFMMDSLSGATANDLSNKPAVDIDLIQEINTKPNVAWKAGVNKVFAGQTLAQVQRKYLGAKRQPKAINKDREAHFAKLVANAPTDFDWRTQPLGDKCIHPIRNQLKCGSCWAFSASEALSDRFCLASNGTVNEVLSPQFMVSCDKSNYGCNGGYLSNAWNFMKKQGLPTDECMPYTAGQGHVEACSSKCQDGSDPKFYHAENYFRVRGGSNEIMAELMANGPIQLGFDVYEDFLQYSGGVYHHVSGRMLGGHAVKLVGFGYSESQKMPYWIIANSWGEEWGMNGYFWMKRGNDECGIEGEAYTGAVKLN